LCVCLYNKDQKELERKLLALSSSSSSRDPISKKGKQQYGGRIYIRLGTAHKLIFALCII
jgi:isoprenylcysteine carboxyl methyltransferase (ICMT) family protein YpbQ